MTRQSSARSHGHCAQGLRPPIDPGLMALQPCHAQDEVIPRIQVDDQTAFHAIEVQELHAQVHRYLGYRDAGSRRQTDSDEITLTRSKRLSIQLTSFHRRASGVIA